MFLVSWPEEFDVEVAVLTLFLRLTVFALRTAISSSEGGDKSASRRSECWVAPSAGADFPEECVVVVASAAFLVPRGAAFNMYAIFTANVVNEDWRYDV